MDECLQPLRWLALDLDGLRPHRNGNILLRPALGVCWPAAMRLFCGCSALMLAMAITGTAAENESKDSMTAQQILEKMAYSADGGRVCGFHARKGVILPSAAFVYASSPPWLHRSNRKNLCAFVIAMYTAS